MAMGERVHGRADTPRYAKRASQVAGRAFNFFWLLADQGIFAFTNFLLNILFARWLSVSEYGLFAISFSGYLILTVLHHGMILEPLLVQSGKIKADTSCHRSYIFTAAKAHALVDLAVAAMCLIGWLIARALGAPAMGWGIIGAGVGGMMLLTLLTARRLCLIFISARSSAMIGSIYFVGVISSAYSLHINQTVTWLNLWLVLGTWALMCALLIFALLCRATDGHEPYPLSRLYRFQRQYATFATGAALSQWFRFDGALMLLAGVAGAEAVATIRAIFNFASPASQVNLALTTTWLLHAAETQGRRVIWPVAVGYGIVASLFVVMGWWFADDLIRFVYGGRYLDGAWQLPLLLLTVAFNGLESLLTSQLKGRGLIWRGYVPPIGGAVVSMVVAIILVPWLGIVGAICAMVASFASGLILGMCVYR